MIRQLITRLISKSGYSRLREGAKISYSQCGEDLIVWYIFMLRGISRPSYMDIGAHHPFFLSNTALLYHHGCRGINIEANPVLFENFENHRPGDVNLNMGIGPAEAVLNFYVMEDPTLSSFSKKEVDILMSHQKKISKEIEIGVRTIDYVLKKYCNNIFPDFLSIDVEGLDFEIIRTIDFARSSPKVICVEAAEYSSTGNGGRRNELIDFILAKGYIEYANTNLNAILVKHDFWNNR